MRAAGQVFGVQPNILSSISNAFSALQNQSFTAGGRNEILQTLGDVNVQSGQLVATQTAAISAALQAQLTATTAQQDKEAYVTALTTAQEQAGIQAACTAAANTGTGITIPACNNPSGNGVNGGGGFLIPGSNTPITPTSYVTTGNGASN